MARPRTHTLPKQIRTPQTTNEWTRLMMAVIDRAEQVGSNHLPGLRLAQADGKAEAFLRRLGIIHTGDIERELPLP
jgi:hypothetical protein